MAPFKDSVGEIMLPAWCEVDNYLSKPSMVGHFLSNGKTNGPKALHDRILTP